MQNTHSCQGAEYRAAYDLGDGVQVTVRTDYAPLLPHLDEFYTRTDIATATGWFINVRFADPTPGMATNPWGNGYYIDPAHQVWLRQTSNPFSLCAGTRIALREVLVAEWESRSYTMLHAAAIRKDNLLVLFTGNMRAGKTTLALRAALQYGFELVSNDHTAVYRDGNDLLVTEIPDVTAVRIATYLQMEQSMPYPFDPNGVDIEAWRPRPVQEQIAAGDEHVMYYSRVSLGQPRRTTVRCGTDTETRVVVISPTFAPLDSPVSPPKPVQDAASLLLPHIRVKWAFDRMRNTHELPRGERSPERFLADGQDLVHALTARAQAYTWQHHGDISTLLEILNATA